jgi:hypothetical protein
LYIWTPETQQWPSLDRSTFEHISEILSHPCSTYSWWIRDFWKTLSLSLTSETVQNHWQGFGPGPKTPETCAWSGCDSSTVQYRYP